MLNKRYFIIFILLFLSIAGFLIITDLYRSRFSAIVEKSSESTQVVAAVDPQLKFTVKPVFNTDTLASLHSAYPIDAVYAYKISDATGVEYELVVARYKDEQGDRNHAIIYLPHDEKRKDNIISSGNKSSHFRYEKWLSVVNAVNKYTDDTALFVSFWDNAQRIHLFTGRKTWVSLPDKNAYSTKQEKELWESIAGGFDNKNKMSEYSKLLTLDLGTALTELKNKLPKDREVYLLISTDDLSHAQEISILNNLELPLETRLFPAGSDLHKSISNIKEWAGEGKGTGTYLVQPVSERFIRVWRTTDKDFDNSLLIRLLPFTTSLDRPGEQIKLVFQSDWGAYLSIYKLVP